MAFPAMTLWVSLTLLEIVAGLPAVPLNSASRPHSRDVRNGYDRQIQPLSCRSRNGQEMGVCMFAWNCAESGGRHLGTCIDRFYFGSCCSLPSDPDTSNLIKVEPTGLKEDGPPISSSQEVIYVPFSPSTKLPTSTIVSSSEETTMTAAITASTSTTSTSTSTTTTSTSTTTTSTSTTPTSTSTTTTSTSTTTTSTSTTTTSTSTTTTSTSTTTTTITSTTTSASTTSTSSTLMPTQTTTIEVDATLYDDDVEQEEKTELLDPNQEAEVVKISPNGENDFLAINITVDENLNTIAVEPELSNHVELDDLEKKPKPQEPDSTLESEQVDEKIVLNAQEVLGEESSLGIDIEVEEIEESSIREDDSDSTNTKDSLATDEAVINGEPDANSIGGTAASDPLDDNNAFDSTTLTSELLTKEDNLPVFLNDNHEDDMATTELAVEANADDTTLPTAVEEEGSEPPPVPPAVDLISDNIVVNAVTPVILIEGSYEITTASVTIDEESSTKDDEALSNDATSTTTSSFEEDNAEVQEVDVVASTEMVDLVQTTLEADPDQGLFKEATTMTSDLYDLNSSGLFLDETGTEKADDFEAETTTSYYSTMLNAVEITDSTTTVIVELTTESQSTEVDTEVANFETTVDGSKIDDVLTSTEVLETMETTTVGSQEEGVSKPEENDFDSIMTELLEADPAEELEALNYTQICGRQPWLSEDFRLRHYKYRDTSNITDSLPKKRTIRSIFRSGRIVNGERAEFGKWPWQISLRQWRTATYLHKCGAALLTKTWAITAAHCVVNVDPDSLLLRMGEYDLSNEYTEPYQYQDRKVAIVVTHTKFDPLTFEYDLALLRFHDPVKFQPNILPVCLPDVVDKDYVGNRAFVTGWGRLYDDGPLPAVLQEVDLPVIRNDECEKMYERAGYRESLPPIFLCAGYQEGGRDSCEGDSGGPMVVQNPRNGRWELAGVISWGIGCAKRNQPGVMTNVAHFKEWIQVFLTF